MSSLTLIYFVYGLSFFCMGLLAGIEGGRSSDARLRHALRPLAVFGLTHGIHEWLEMFHAAHLLPLQSAAGLGWSALVLALLAFSFLSLAAFGASLLSSSARFRRYSMLVPVCLVAIWGVGVFTLQAYYGGASDVWDMADVWTRYSLAMPAALLAAAGLVAQQRTFRRAGLRSFGRDSLWAAVAFAWYGLVGQMFTQRTALPPSNLLNDELFLELIGFPVQLLRAAAALAAAIFVIRFLRAFEVEAQRQIASLQAVRVEEAERREALRGELLRRVVAAQEAERQRIARELHDATGQALTALGLGLRAVGAGLAPEAGQAARDLRQLESLTESSLDELRHLIADLRPSHLDDLGLAATTRWYAKEVQARTGLDVQVAIVGEPKILSAPVRIALFRIAQEALTNIIKHSSAHRAWIRLEFCSEAVRLEVKDDGCGFDPAPAAPGSRPAWGLLGIQERVTLLGGQYQLETSPGHGTRVEVVIPDRREVEGAL
jgi:signal transduction histidine kinase